MLILEVFKHLIISPSLSTNSFLCCDKEHDADDPASCPACYENWPWQIGVGDCLDGDDDLLAYLRLDDESRRAVMGGRPRAYLESVTAKSDLLEIRMPDRGLYLLHAATNCQVLRALLYAYGAVMMDPTQRS